MLSKREKSTQRYRAPVAVAMAMAMANTYIGRGTRISLRLCVYIFIRVRKEKKGTFSTWSADWCMRRGGNMGPCIRVYSIRLTSQTLLESTNSVPCFVIQ